MSIIVFVLLVLAAIYFFVAGLWFVWLAHECSLKGLDQWYGPAYLALSLVVFWIAHNTPIHFVISQ